MGNLLRSEWFKLWKDRSYWTLLMALSGAAVFYTGLVGFDEDGVSSAMSVSDLYTQAALGGNGYMIRLVPVILAGFFISSEYANGTMKSMIASGNSRLRIYSAKLIAFMAGAAILAAMFPLWLTITAALGSGFYDMPAWDYWVRTLLLHMLYAAGFASIMALAAIQFTDSGKTIGFLLLFFLLIDSILFFISQKVDWFRPIFDYSIFHMFNKVGHSSLTAGDWIPIVASPVLSGVAMWLLGYLVFERKEIK